MDARVLIFLTWLLAGTAAVAQPANTLDAPVTRQPGGAAVNLPAPLDAVAAAQLREQALDVLTDLAQRGEPQVRANALEGLALVPTRLEPVIRRALVDENPGVRAVAAMAAGKARLASVAEFVRPLLNDPSNLVRASAIVGLSQIAMSPAGRSARIELPDPSPLARMLWSRDPREQGQAAFALGEIGNTSALPMLREAVRQPMPRAGANEKRIVQLQMNEAMAKMGDDTVLGEIRAALYPSSPADLEVAALAAQVVGQVGDKQSILQLDYLCQPRNTSGRTGGAAPDEGQMPAEVRLAAAAAIGKLGDPMGIPTATEFLTSPSPAYRAAAALAIGEAGRVSTLSLALLQPVINDPEPSVQAAAAAGIIKATDGR